MNSEERVRRGAEKLQKFLNSKQQGRLDGFFSVNPKKKEKATAPAKGKGKGKGKGGVMMPDEWPWEDAKKIFEKPDVLPADEVEVSTCGSTEDFCLIVLVAGVEQPRCRWFGPILSNRKRIQASFFYRHLLLVRD